MSASLQASFSPLDPAVRDGSLGCMGQGREAWPQAHASARPSAYPFLKVAKFTLNNSSGGRFKSSQCRNTYTKKAEKKATSLSPITQVRVTI